ncbi:MAG: HAMP domain-containing protein, partial [Clostridiales bacterium]|nr:HAMP domain-containing protein [Clostridiales bacterium]
MNKKRTFTRNSLTMQVNILVLLVIILSCGSICFLSYYLAKDMAIQNVSHEAMSVAQTVASSIDSERFQKIVDSGVEDDYYESTGELLDKTITNTGALFLYVLLGEYTDSEVVYFNEGQSMDNYDVYGLGVTESVEYFPDVMFESIDEGISTQSDVFFSDLYGASIAGYSPVINSEGKVIGVVGVEFALKDVMAPFNKFVTILIIAVVIFCLIFCIFTSIIAVKTLVMPVKVLADAALNVSGGDFDVVMPKAGQNELGTLSNSFTVMISTINMLTGEIEAVAKAQSAGILSRLLDENLYSGEYKNIAVIINKMITEQNSITETAIKCVYEVGLGHFNAQVPQFPGDKAILNETIELLRKNL